MFSSLGEAEPTRSILYRSAASLAISAGEPIAAVSLIRQGLAGNPAPKIKAELLALLGDAKAKMIYTIDNKASYERAIAEYGRPLMKLGKRPPGEMETAPDGYGGGYAFQTAADAQRRIDEAYAGQGFVVWAMAADWQTDTYPAPGGWWHLLINDAEIIGIVDE